MIRFEVYSTRIRRRRHYDGLVMVPLYSTLLAIAMTGGLLLVIHFLQLLFERLQRRQWARRFVPWTEVAAASSRGEGTLIPSGQRVWWTPMKLGRGADEPYLLAYDRLGGESDDVCLSDPPRGMRDARSLRRAFPLATIFEPREVG